MKIRFVPVILFLCALPAFTQTAPPAIDPAKAADIRRLIELTGGKDIGVQLMRQMMAQTRQMQERRLPQDERSQRLFNAYMDKSMARLEASTDELINRLIPIYDRHFSREEIQGLIGFYESPLGRKVIGEMPQVIQESFATGVEWGKEITAEVRRELQEEFPELKDLPPPN